MKVSIRIEDCEYKMLEHCLGKTGHCLGFAKYHDRNVPPVLEMLMKYGFIRKHGYDGDFGCYSTTKKGKAILLLCDK